MADQTDTPLRREIFRRIENSPENSLEFAEFMKIALYDPESGYYANPEKRRIGRHGDFFTSVSVGACFGNLLGWEIERRWRELFGSPNAFTIVEQGAHDGQLAVDFLTGLEMRQSALSGAIRYVIIEPSDRRRNLLQQRFDRENPKLAVELVPDATEIRAAAGIFLCNELLDAFPVSRIRFSDGSWKELRVGLENRALCWAEGKSIPKSQLPEQWEQYGPTIEEGHTAEICPGLDPWIDSLSPIFEQGFWWMIDYGHEESEFFRPEKRDGTLQCYREHRVVNDPFENIGETDITAHVNFSHLTRAAQAAGLQPAGLVDQHIFLTRSAVPWLREIETAGSAQDPEIRKLLRQFQTLTHPGMLGRAFKVAEFSRGF